MPFINSKITLKVEKEIQDVIKERLGKAIELIPGKSESWLMVGFEDEYSLYFKGQDCEKAAFVEVKVLGTVTKESYDQLTAEICKIYKEVLDIPGDQIYIKYEEVSHWGYNGFNF